MSHPTKSKTYTAHSYAKGKPSKDNFLVVEKELPKDLDDGQILLKILMLSVDPYHKLLLSGQTYYQEPVKLGDALTGATVSEVIASKNPKFNVGDCVSGFTTWSDYIVSDGANLTVLHKDANLEANLGVMGLAGMTAYFGLFGKRRKNIIHFEDTGKLTSTDVVLVSGAAGAVGSVVGQIAKSLGCKVIGIAGSDDKVQWLVKDLGFDFAINYKTEKNLTEAIRKVAPEGIDLYFENVGGEVYDAAIQNMRLRGRIVICGAISGYNDVPTGKRWEHTFFSKRLRQEGMLILDFWNRFGEAYQYLSNLYNQGKLKSKSTTFEGFDNVPNALAAIFDGVNTGKMLVKL